MERPARAAAPVAASAADDSRDLVDEAYSTLLDMIQLGQLPINQPLQERNLASALGVSRTPLREAMSRLIGGGFAVRTARGQLIVPEPTLRQYLEIFQMRLLLEGDAAAAAATRITRPGSFFGLASRARTTSPACSTTPSSSGRRTGARRSRDKPRRGKEFPAVRIPTSTE